MASRVSPTKPVKERSEEAGQMQSHLEIVGVAVCGHSHHPSHLVLSPEPHRARRDPCVQSGIQRLKIESCGFKSVFQEVGKQNQTYKVSKPNMCVFSPNSPFSPPYPLPACLRVSHLWNLVQVLRQFGFFETYLAQINSMQHQKEFPIFSFV